MLRCAHSRCQHPVDPCPPWGLQQHPGVGGPLPRTLAPYLLAFGTGRASDSLEHREERGEVSRAAQGCSPSSWLGKLPTAEAPLHSPALGLQHPLALPWDRQGPKVPACPGTSSTALSLSCRQARLSLVGLPLGWDRVSSNLPSSQASLPRRPSPARHPCLARLASRFPPVGSKNRAGARGSCSRLSSPEHPH